MPARRSPAVEKLGELHMDLVTRRCMCEEIFYKTIPQTHCLVSIPSQAGWETACRSTKMHILQDCVLEGKKKWGKSSRQNWKKEISFSEGGGAAWLLTKQFQSVGPVLLQCSLRARGPGGTTAAMQVCGGREREGIFFFQLLFRQLEREKLGNGCIKVEPVLSWSHCGGWYSR